MRSNFSPAHWCCLVAVICLSMGCTKKSDPDGTCARAKGLNTLVVVTDKLDVKGGDRSDCRKMSFASDGIAVVTYTIGRPFQKHKIHGEIIAYNSNEIVVTIQRVAPAVKVVELRFPVERDLPYYVDFKGVSGKHGYTIKLAHVDPCEKCGSNDDCVNGRCEPRACEPACDEFSEICEAGRCISPCSPRCRSGKVCDANRERCGRNSRERFAPPI